MSNVTRVTEELVVGRGDPVYMAHAYLTKVPVPAITPFVEAYTEPGDVVVDPFAGSGMTGVAAAALGRRARLFDISVLGRHIGRNYVNLVDAELLRKQAGEIVAAVYERLGEVYSVACASCGDAAELTKRVWSIAFECGSCAEPFSYYRALEAAGWCKPAMTCPTCSASVSSRARRIGEQPMLDHVSCPCSARQQEQPAGAERIDSVLDALPYPRVEITPDRQMYKASALGRNGLTTVSSFYSARNLAVLTVLRDEIGEVADEELRAKLLFAFTASLTRASKRYQWSRQRPLNAANANYYVAPVFYEWNVFDLFLRKIEAVIRSDDWLLARFAGPVSLFGDQMGIDLDVTYELSSANAIPLEDNSVDYVFTDPPFGSNLFYADMALFHEAWLDGFTDVDQEAVIDRGVRKRRSASDYERLLTEALAECRRILKPGGRVSMVFGNSTGSVWSLVQRAIHGAGLVVDTEALVVLNKGQRSVKGLASGFEHVATLDLIITMSAASTSRCLGLKPVPRALVSVVVRELVRDCRQTTPSHLYLELLRRGFTEDWDLATLDLKSVTDALRDDGWIVDPKRGHLARSSEATRVDC